MVKGVDKKQPVKRLPVDGDLDGVNNAADSKPVDKNAKVEALDGVATIEELHAQKDGTTVDGYETSHTQHDEPVEGKKGGTRDFEMALKSGKLKPEDMKRLRQQIIAEGGGGPLTELLNAAGGKAKQVEAAVADIGDGGIDDIKDPEIREMVRYHLGNQDEIIDSAAAVSENLRNAVAIARQRRGDPEITKAGKRRKAKQQQKTDAKFFQREMDNRYLNDLLGDREVADRGMEDNMVADASMVDDQVERDEHERRMLNDEVSRRRRSRRT